MMSQRPTLHTALDFTPLQMCPSFLTCSSETPGSQVLLRPNALQVCSEGYQRNPVSSGDAASPDVSFDALGMKTGF